jgi:hypothetical protein
MEFKEKLLENSIKVKFFPHMAGSIEELRSARFRVLSRSLGSRGLRKAGF